MIAKSKTHNMKNVKFLFTTVIIAMLSCRSPQEKNTEKITSFIAGTYARAFEGEYSIGHDTLIISQPDAANNFYNIQHNSSYQKIREKQLQPMEYKSENWMAIFDEKTNMLLEQKKGKQITFLPDKNELMLGSSHFKKIK
jgi:hypothetical protein